MRKPDCYEECPLQQYTYDKYCHLLGVVVRQAAAGELTGHEKQVYADSLDYLRLQSETAQTTCITPGKKEDLSAYNIPLTRTNDMYCTGDMPENLEIYFGNPAPDMP